MHYTPENQHRDGSKHFIQSRRDQDGVNWICVRIGKRKGPWQKQTDYRGTSRKVLAALDEAGFNFSLEQFEEIRQHVQALTKFECVTRFTQSGWTGNKFALTSGTILSKVQPDHSIIGFRPRNHHTSQAGTHEIWVCPE